MSRAERSGWHQVEMDPKTSAVMALGGVPKPWCYQKEVADGHLTVLVGPEPDGFHLSISHRTNDTPPRPGRYPSWDEIVEARYEFCPPAMTMAMFLPPKEEYVNVHETTFHLWSIQ
jgi:hypothetical protein